MADAATTAAVARAYATFFSGAKHPAEAMAALQNAQELAGALAVSAKSPMGSDVTARVSRVVLVNPHVADVTFTVLSKGSPIFSDSSGKAVLVGGAWKLAAYTFCGLMAAEQGGKIPAACTKPGVTSLPSS